MSSHPFPAHAYQHLLAHRDRIHELAELRHDVISRNLPSDDYVLSEIDNASRLCRVYDRCIIGEWYCDSHCVRCGFATTAGNYCARCRSAVDQHQSCYLCGQPVDHAGICAQCSLDDGA